jgi:23S rRNA G2069 N7-methylase RlmK/C1962 C5-methylase RlmI
MLTTEDEPIDRAFFERRLERALRYRQRVVQDTNAIRLLFSESDGLPGLIVDQYADYLVVQVRTLGMERLRELWLPTLIERWSRRAFSNAARWQAARRKDWSLSQAFCTAKCPNSSKSRRAG